MPFSVGSCFGHSGHLYPVLGRFFAVAVSLSSFPLGVGAFLGLSPLTMMSAFVFGWHFVMWLLHHPSVL